MESQTSLTSIEQSELSRLESIIEKGQQTFVEVGSALMEIRDSGLYKMFGTFEHYCKEKWGYSRPRAYQLIESAKVKEILSTVVDTPIPERQSRPLSGLSPFQKKKAWDRAVETAPEGKVTAKHVENTVNEIKKSPKPGPPNYGIQFARMAIMDLEKIADNDIYRDEGIALVKEWIKTNERRN